MIKSVWIEIRPALSCCHFCIVLKKKINCPVKINMKKSELGIQISEKKFHIHFRDFTVDPLTLTNFKVINQFLNFRIQVESVKFETKSISPKKIEAPDLGSEKGMISCQCFNSLTREINFKRILPLPSTELSLSDLFCHVHDSSLSNYDVLAPKVTDCFYADHFITVNQDIISGCFNKGKFLKCKRCLANVGVQHKNYSNLWMSSLRLPNNHRTPLMQLKRFVKNAVSDPFSLFPHILFESEEINSYLSIIVVDKHLILSSCQQNLQLENDQVVKLKYNFYSSFESKVKSLKNDPFNTLYHVHVEKSFLNFTLKYLISCSESVPVIFNKIDGAYMAYLNLND